MERADLFRDRAIVLAAGGVFAAPLCVSLFPQQPIRTDEASAVLDARRTPCPAEGEEQAGDAASGQHSARGDFLWVLPGRGRWFA